MGRRGRYPFHWYRNAVSDQSMICEVFVLESKYVGLFACSVVARNNGALHYHVVVAGRALKKS